MNIAQCFSDPGDSVENSRNPEHRHNISSSVARYKIALFLIWLGYLK